MMSFFLRSKPDEKAYQNKDKSADFGIILLFFVKTLKRHQLLRGASRFDEYGREYALGKCGWSIYCHPKWQKIF